MYKKEEDVAVIRERPTLTPEEVNRLLKAIEELKALEGYSSQSQTPRLKERGEVA